MNFSAPQPVEPTASVTAKDALRFENQQIRPARQTTDASSYDLMIRQIDKKPSTRETLLTLASY
ncbi:hypothetical protein [Pseudomonas sp. BIC9C]|uniref:hypothetical protein n=1 Tax=Pseudomonas sp. BIC9C TaxID=3078458 RepID=UPI002AD226DC|nr:hypothetical protein [Pseudomonas sp. BIC9C]